MDRADTGGTADAEASREAFGSRLLAMNEPPSALRSAIIVAGLTVALGGTVAVSWFAFGGSASFRGPVRALEEAWPAIYGGQALFAAALGFVVARPLTNAFGRRGAAFAVLAAWIGEFVVLFFGGTLFAGELVPQVAWFYWFIGTAGPMQPITALVGLWIGSRRGRTPQAPMAEARSIRPS